MSVTTSPPDLARNGGTREATLDLFPETASARYRHAAADLRRCLKLWRLCCALGWLDVKLRYRGSILGPFWLTASTTVMVGSMGVIYAFLFKMNLHDYLPFLTVSLVLWGFISGMVGDSTSCFTQSENMIRSIRMPFTVYAARVTIRNLLVLAHNVVVVLAVFAVFRIYPGLAALQALPALALWMLDGIAACILLGALGARFRDITPIIGSILQILFFITPIIWKPELMKHGREWLPFNPFYDLLELVRRPLLGDTLPSEVIWAAIGYSAILWVVTALMFARVRARLAYWV